MGEVEGRTAARAAVFDPRTAPSAERACPATTGRVAMGVETAGGGAHGSPGGSARPRRRSRARPFAAAYDSPPTSKSGGCIRGIAVRSYNSDGTSWRAAFPGRKTVGASPHRPKVLEGHLHQFTGRAVNARAIVGKAGFLAVMGQAGDGGPKGVRRPVPIGVLLSRFVGLGEARPRNRD